MRSDLSAKPHPFGINPTSDPVGPDFLLDDIFSAANQPFDNIRTTCESILISEGLLFFECHGRWLAEKYIRFWSMIRMDF